MQKTKALKILIPIMALVLIFQLISGAFPALVPYAVHRAAGLLLAAIVILHVILNWPWIRANYFKR
ncbi:MAG: hypothetical protein JW748_03800 [Anaerolineales bacterium]|nr:hypothetical protein [Anaerolineales bacterium]